MESSRRHELEQNSLYQALSRLPAFAAEYGAYILLGIAIVVALYFYFSTQRTTALREREAEAIGIYSMSETIQNARSFRETLARFGGALTPGDLARQIADFSSEFEGYSMLPDTSQRPGIRARALRLRGDYNWTLATFHNVVVSPPTTAPSTQPQTRPDSPQILEPEPYLAAAEAAYRQVLEEYPEQLSDVLTARFGLAAIAEQRGQFEGAAEHYDAIVALADASEGVKALAGQRKDLLKLLALEPRLAKPLPTSLPSTLPATLPASQPSTQPQMQPPAPADSGEPAATQPTDPQD